MSAKLKAISTEQDIAIARRDALVAGDSVIVNGQEAVVVEDQDGETGLMVTAKAPEVQTSYRAPSGHCGRLRYAGDRFFMPLHLFKPAPGGIGLSLPSWVSVSEIDPQTIADEKAKAANKFRDAAIASSGSRGYAKKRSFVEAMPAGEKPLPRAAQAALDSATPKHVADAKRAEIRSMQPADLPVIEKEE